jgi:hypothetical protein
MTKNKFIKQTYLLMPLLAMGGIFVFVSYSANALANNDMSSGGSSTLIGLPSNSTYYQDAGSQAQSGNYSNPVGGSKLLQEDKSATLSVDSPATIGSSVDAQSTSNNMWWLLLLSIAASIALVVIIIVAIPNSFWKKRLEEEVEQESKEEAIIPPASLPIEHVDNSEHELGVPMAVEQDQSYLDEIPKAQEETAHRDEGLPVLEETPPKPVATKTASKKAKKSTKKRKHGGRGAKKSKK